MRQAYILVFDPTYPTPLDVRALCGALNRDFFIKDWWHFLPSAFILISDYFPANLATQMKVLLPGRSHLILKADLQNASGMLPKEAWDWINQRVPTTKHFFG